MREKLKNTKGITLIALIITIIILLILAMVTIRILMNQGIIGHAKNATNSYVIAEEKEKITLGYQNYKMDKIANPNAELTVDNATVEGSEAEGGWTITFTKTGNVYTLDTNGSIAKKDDPSKDEIRRIRAGYTKYQEDKANSNVVNQTDLDLLTQYCIGNNDKDLLEDVIDESTMKFKDREPIPNAEEELTYTGMDQAEVNGAYELYIYFTYNEKTYKLTSGYEEKEVDGSTTYSYPTKSVEFAPDDSGVALTVEGAIVEGNEENGWTITFSDTGNKYSLNPDGTVEAIQEFIIDKTKLNLYKEGDTAETDTLSVTVRGGIKDTVSWEVEDTGIATISSNKGTKVTVTPVAIGSTKITAKCGGYTQECIVTVNDDLSLIRLYYGGKKLIDTVDQKNSAGSKIKFLDDENSIQDAGTSLSYMNYQYANDGGTIYYIKYNNKAYRIYMYDEVISRDNITLIYSPKGKEGSTVTYSVDGTESNSTSWKVLYDDGDGTVELVSPSTIGSYQLGKGDPAAVGDSDVDKVIDSYNNAVTRLNAYCRTRITNSTAKRVRSVGSNHSNPDTDTTQMYNGMSGAISEYNGKVKVSDENWEQDYIRMLYWGVNKTTNVKDFYLASRRIYGGGDNVKLMLRVDYTSSVDDDAGATLWTYRYSTMNTYNAEYNVRACVVVNKSDVGL